MMREGKKKVAEKESDWIQNGRMVVCARLGNIFLNFHLSEGVSPDLLARKTHDCLAAVNRQTAVWTRK